MIKFTTFAAAAAFVLAACGTPGSVTNPTQQQIDQGFSNADKLLTASQRAMCAAQAGANQASMIATIAGDPESAKNAAKASAAAGVGCTWQTPPPPPSPVPVMPAKP